MSENVDDPKKDTSKEEPKTEPKPKFKDAEVVSAIPEDGILVTKSEFANMQKTMMDLQKESDEAKKATVKAERDAIYNELLILNPKLAKIHIESGKEVLQGALSAAKEIKTGFQSLSTSKDKDPPKADEGSHDSMKYDFIASRKEGKDIWVFS